MILRIVGFLLLSLSSAAATDWTVDYENSQLGFEGSQTGTVFEGYFKTFTATIQFDPERLDSTAIEVIIDTSSARTGNPERDSILPGADWFDIASHPTAQFSSNSVVYLDNKYTAIGVLTLKGTAREVHLPFSLKQEGDTTRAVGTLTIDRNDFGIGTGPLGPMVGNDVTIKFHLTATR